jgi:hypothetical protein
MSSPNKPQPKKVFDVMRPGKALASPTSRPVITGHKKIKEDMFVSGKDSGRADSNPLDDDRQLMSHKDDKFAGVAASPQKEADEPLGKAEQSSGAPTIETAVPPVSQETPAEEKPKLPANFPDEQDEDVPTGAPEMSKPADSPEEGHNEDIALVPDEAQAPDDTTKSEQTDAALEDLKTQFAEDKPTDDTPDKVMTKEPMSPAPQPEADEPKAMSHDDVLAATGAPVLEHAVVSHHKTKAKWWEWALIFVLVVVVALVALNFLLDAEVITVDVDVPHTNLIK